MISSGLGSELPASWDQAGQIMQAEKLTAVSNEEAKDVFQMWKAEEEQEFSEIMEIDQEIGSDLLVDDIFSSPCNSPICCIEELALEGLKGPCEGSLLPSDNSSTFASNLGVDEKYKAHLSKLSESMKRSHETRKSLLMETPKTEKYTRDVFEVIASIERSSQQLQAYLKTG